MFYFVRTTLVVKISEKFCRREKKDVYSLDIVYFTSFDAPCYLITLLCVVTSFSFFASEMSDVIGMCCHLCLCVVICVISC